MNDLETMDEKRKKLDDVFSDLYTSIESVVDRYEIKNNIKDDLCNEILSSIIEVVRDLSINNDK